jgi:hypothetical protein
VSARDWRQVLGLLAAAAAAFALLSAAGAVGLRWDPFGLQARRLERSEAEVQRLRARLTAVTAALEAGRELSVETRAAAARTAAAAEAANALETLARGAPDATSPLDPDRLDRLRAHDRRLCELAPALEGCASTAPAAGGGAAAVPAGHPSGKGDAGGS